VARVTWLVPLVLAAAASGWTGLAVSRAKPGERVRWWGPSVGRSWGQLLPRLVTLVFGVAAASEGRHAVGDRSWFLALCAMVVPFELAVAWHNARLGRTG
jgi:hypothetical protein